MTLLLINDHVQLFVVTSLTIFETKLITSTTHVRQNQGYQYI